MNGRRGARESRSPLASTASGGPRAGHALALTGTGRDVQARVGVLRLGALHSPHDASSVRAASRGPQVVSAPVAARVASDADVVIVGGGIAGASTAFHLTALGHRVILLERGDIASGASGVNAGMIDSTGWGHARDLHDHLTAGSLEIFEVVQLDHGEDIELRRSGSLQAIHTAAQLEHARQRVAALQAGGHRIELLDGREARSLEPAVSPSLIGAVYSPLRSQADPERATRAFARLAERQGARILTGRAVTAIGCRAGGGWIVRTAGGDVVGQSLVIAAGAWCAPVAALIDLTVPVIPVRGQMWATAPLPPRVFQTISSAESALTWDTDRGGELSERDRREGEPPDLTHRGGRRTTRHLYGRQRRNGEVIFGGDREPLGWTPTVDPAGIDVNHGQAAEVLPFLSAERPARTWAGLMPFSLDGQPLIGRLPGRDDAWIVTGLASSGFGRGPMAGKLLAEAIHASTPSPLLAEADPARCVREAATGAAAT
jgi:sarcosine oxidase subunit beta